MERSERTLLIIGAAAGLTGVLAGTFGAHGLEGRVADDLLETFEVGVQYHLVHALAILAAAWACGRSPGRAASAAGWLFTFGIVVFSGSLYVLAVTGLRWLGAITPIGGVAFLGGWVTLGVGAIRARPDEVNRPGHE